MTQWAWLRREVVVVTHELQLAQHGGMAGVREAGLLVSAVGKAPNLADFGEPNAPPCLNRCVLWPPR